MVFAELPDAGKEAPGRLATTVVAFSVLVTVAFKPVIRGGRSADRAD